MKKKKREESVTPNGQPPVHLLPTAETETDTDMEYVPPACEVTYLREDEDASLPVCCACREEEEEEEEKGRSLR